MDQFYTNVVKNLRRHKEYVLLGAVVFFVLVGLVDKTLMVALFVLGVLAAGTLGILTVAQPRVQKCRTLFLISVLIFMVASISIHYLHFYPFGGGEGDQRSYHAAALDISKDFRAGDFSLTHIKARLIANAVEQHWYPALVGALYAFTLPDLLVGKMLSVWFAALSVVLVFLLALELGASERLSFRVGLIASIFPSYVYYGSLLLRESMVALLVLLCILLMVKIVKRFAWEMFAMFYVFLGIAISLRFYVGLVILYSFVGCVLCFLHFKWRKKLLYGIIIVLLLGILPQLMGRGFFGVSEVRSYLVPRQILAYREYTDVPPIQKPSQASPSSSQSSQPLAGGFIKSILGQQIFKSLPDILKNTSLPLVPHQEEVGSTIKTETKLDRPFVFLKNYFTSFLYVLVGPFPWDIRYVRQLFVLLEVIPWWIVFFLIVRGIVKHRTEYRRLLPIVLVSLGIIAALALLINNYGTYMRIRIPAILALLSLLPLSFTNKDSYGYSKR